MNTHELRTRPEKPETRTEKKLRKAETNLRFSAQPETKTAFTNDLHQFSLENKNSLKQPRHTTTVDSADPAQPSVVLVNLKFETRTSPFEFIWCVPIGPVSTRFT